MTKSSKEFCINALKTSDDITYESVKIIRITSDDPIRIPRKMKKEMKKGKVTYFPKSVYEGIKARGKRFRVSKSIAKDSIRIIRP